MYWKSLIKDFIKVQQMASLLAEGAGGRGLWWHLRVLKEGVLFPAELMCSFQKSLFSWHVCILYSPEFFTDENGQTFVSLQSAHFHIKQPSSNLFFILITEGSYLHDVIAKAASGQGFSEIEHSISFCIVEIRTGKLLCMA